MDLDNMLLGNGVVAEEKSSDEDEDAGQIKSTQATAQIGDSATKERRLSSVKSDEGDNRAVTIRFAGTGA